VLEHRFEVRLPLAEIVVDVDNGNTRFLRPPFQHGQPLGHRQRVCEQLLAAAEFEIVDHVNQQQGHFRLVGHKPVQVFILRRHAPSHPLCTSNLQITLSVRA
jgi:hypothetical protein